VRDGPEMKKNTIQNGYLKHNFSFLDSNNYPMESFSSKVRDLYAADPGVLPGVMSELSNAGHGSFRRSDGD
jgi:hypothetical protein